MARTYIRRVPAMAPVRKADGCESQPTWQEGTRSRGRTPDAGPGGSQTAAWPLVGGGDLVQRQIQTGPKQLVDMTQVVDVTTLVDVGGFTGTPTLFEHVTSPLSAPGSGTTMWH